MNETYHEHCAKFKISDFCRNNYYYGKCMTARDFFAEQNYFNKKRRLISQMVHGWGVVCGLDVLQPDKKVNKWVITPGLAIDCCGREILISDDVTQENRTLAESEIEAICPPIQGKENLLICLEYDECKTEQVDIHLSECGQEEKTEFNRIRDSFRMVLRKEGDVNLSKPYGKHCPLSEIKVKKDAEHESFQQCIDTKLKAGCSECTERDHIVLARLVPPKEIDADRPPPPPVDGQESISEQSQSIKIYELDHHFERRLVYSNPLLYDLIHCIHNDLPHIKYVSWDDPEKEADCWKNRDAKEMTWQQFKENIVKNGLRVIFDRKMNLATINEHNFVVTAYIREFGTGYFIKKYIPLSKVTPDAVGGDMVEFQIRERWKMEETDDHSDSEILRQISSKRTDTDPNRVRFEIILKGSSILDDNCRALDGHYDGISLPSGNGVEGGDFVSWFYVVYE